MKNIIDHTFRKLFRYSCILLLVGLVLYSCQNDNLEIQQDFPFEVLVMPVPKEIAKDEYVEIRIKILPEANFSAQNIIFDIFSLKEQES